MYESVYNTYIYIYTFPESAAGHGLPGFLQARATEMRPAAAALGGAGHQGLRRVVQRERHGEMLADVTGGAAKDGGSLDRSLMDAE